MRCFSSQPSFLKTYTCKGEPAPDFHLEYLDRSDASIHTIRLRDAGGTVRLLNVVNSLDTSVCHIETRRWEQLSAELPPGARVCTMSMDLPFALARWQSAEDVTHQALSAVVLQKWRRSGKLSFNLRKAGEWYS
jgi:thioredoxin-dependent peroxiredoxin